MQTCSIARSSCRAASPPESDWHSSSAAQPVPAPSSVFRCASTASIDVASMISISDGTMPSRTIRLTAAPAAATAENAATIVPGACGSGRSASVAWVITPSVPSLPMNSFVRS